MTNKNKININSKNSYKEKCNSTLSGTARNTL